MDQQAIKGFWQRALGQKGGRIALFVGTLITATVLPAHGRAPGGGAGKGAAVQPAAVENQLLVKFRSGASRSVRGAMHAAARGNVRKRFHTVKGLELVELPTGASAAAAALAQYRASPDVLYVEPNYRVEAFDVPNDPSFTPLWGLHNTGQAGGRADADIDAPEAWDITTGDPNVVVAVIDTGVDYRHPDLAANIWRNPGDCDGDRVDSDGNGYVDDCHGIDAANNDADPMDDHFHGTHVSGTIGAVGGNGIGVVGVARRVSILGCKFLNAGGSGDIADAIECLDYVAVMKDRGVNIVATSNSWGGGPFSRALADAIEAQATRGILFVAAAGNSTSDNDRVPAYPASIPLPNVISVAASTRGDELASFSNFGARTVDVGAPGHEILSTVPGGEYATYSGTSMATPHVSGLVALLKAQDPGRDWRALKNLVLVGGDDVPALVGRTLSGKRINAVGSLNCTNTVLFRRIAPAGDTVSVAPGQAVDLEALNLRCAAPNGDVIVRVTPGSQTIVLRDDGVDGDEFVNDGAYHGQFLASAPGDVDLSFPDGQIVHVSVRPGYSVGLTPFVWRNIGGEAIALGDDEARGLSLPFAVQFGEQSYTSLFVGSNGILSFGRGIVSYVNGPLPTGSNYVFAAPFWDDLITPAAYWAVLGTAPDRELVVEWRNASSYACQGAGGVTFQMVLSESTSDVVFNYADATIGNGCPSSRGGSATVGLQLGADRAVQVGFNSANLEDGMALLFHVVDAPPECSSDADCADDLECTADRCENGTCAHPSNDALCDDRDMCTRDRCEQGTCTHRPDDSGCEDGNACTVDRCEDGVCSHRVDDDGCNDDNDCTADSCDPATGCRHVADNAVCDDGDDCTTDICDPAAGCRNIGDQCTPPPDACVPSGDPHARVSINARSGLLTAKIMLPMAYAGAEDTTVILSDEDGNRMNQADVGVLRQVSANAWAMPFPGHGMHKLRLVRRRAGTVLTLKSQKGFASGAARGKDVTFAKLKLKIGESCFTQEMTQRAK